MPRQYHENAMALVPCQCHSNPLSVPWQCHHGNAMAVQWQCCHDSAITMLCNCHGDALAVSWKPIAVLLGGGWGGKEGCVKVCSLSPWPGRRPAPRLDAKDVFWLCFPRAGLHEGVFTVCGNDCMKVYRLSGSLSVWVSFPEPLDLGSPSLDCWENCFGNLRYPALDCLRKCFGDLSFTASDCFSSTAKSM